MFKEKGLGGITETTKLLSTSNLDVYTSSMDHHCLSANFMWLTEGRKKENIYYFNFNEKVKLKNLGKYNITCIERSY